MSYGDPHQWLGLAQRAGALVSGEADCRWAIERRRAALLVLAVDAGQATKRKFRWLAEQAGLATAEFSTKEAIGRAIGRPPRAVVAVTDRGLAESLARALRPETEPNGQHATGVAR